LALESRQREANLRIKEA